MLQLVSLDLYIFMDPTNLIIMIHNQLLLMEIQDIELNH